MEWIKQELQKRDSNKTIDDYFWFWDTLEIRSRCTDRGSYDEDPEECQCIPIKKSDCEDERGLLVSYEEWKTKLIKIVRSAEIDVEEYAFLRNRPPKIYKDPKEWSRSLFKANLKKLRDAGIKLTFSDT